MLEKYHCNFDNNIWLVRMKTLFLPYNFEEAYNIKILSNHLVLIPSNSSDYGGLRGDVRLWIIVTSLLLNCAFIHRFLILTFLKGD